MKKGLSFIVGISFCLLIGALFAIQLMNEERGVSSPIPLEWEEAAPHSDKNTTGAKVTSFNGTDELLVKRQRMEEVGRFNFFSELGGQLAVGFNQASRSFLSSLMSFVHQVLNREGFQEQ